MKITNDHISIANVYKILKMFVKYIKKCQLKKTKVCIYKYHNNIHVITSFILLAFWKGLNLWGSCTFKTSKFFFEAFVKGPILCSPCIVTTICVRYICYFYVKISKFFQTFLTSVIFIQTLFIIFLYKHFSIVLFNVYKCSIKKWFIQKRGFRQVPIFLIIIEGWE